MLRKLLVILVVGLTSPTLTFAASPALPAQAGPPLGVDPSVLQAPTDGPVVATGQLTDSYGQPASGTVAVMAWPNETYNRTLRIGSAVPTPTVGWVAAGPDGSFTLRVDASKIRADYVGPDGVVNLEAIGWTSTSQGRWAFPAHIGGTALSSSAASPATAVASIRLVAKDAPSSVQAGWVGARSNAINPSVGPLYPCSYVLQSTYDAMVVIGYTRPYGADTGWMTDDSSHGWTLGAAISSSGAYGSWSASGSSTVTNGVSFTWVESVSYRDYRVEERYGKYRLACQSGYTNDWWERVQYATGGYQSTNVSNTSFTYCVQVPAGVWTRVSTSGNNFSLGGGVQISPLLGINLSVDTGYSSSHTLNYRLVATGKVCGDNATPTLASNMNSSR